MSKLSVGIVGLPNVGKSTLFKALTQVEVNIANYPFATIDPNIGVVSVPDERLEKLSVLSASAQKIPAVVEFYDIAGLVKGANKGEGLGNKFLSHIKEVRVIVHVVRIFSSGDVMHVDGDVDPVRDIETINTELILKDLDTLDRHIQRVVKEAKAGDAEKRRELSALEDIKTALDGGKPIFSLGGEVANAPFIRELGLLTAKPQIFLLNGSESEAGDALKSKIDELGFAMMVADLGEGAPLGELIRLAYDTLGLITFFTTGEKETRAWTIVNGTKAPQAAGTIHSDFEEKFIRAEVVSYDKFVEAGGWAAARQKGWMRTEGKEYMMTDGDIINVLHS